MNLLDKYIEEVGKRLPLRNRRDLQAEIRSTIEDMVEDRSRETGRPADATLVSDVLLEYGSPDKVAAGYQPALYLIGPRLFPIFSLVVRIVMTVLFTVMLAVFFIQHFSSGLGAAVFAAALVKFLPTLLGAMISAFGNIVIVFAIIERVKPDARFDEEDEKWTPVSLEAEEDPDRAGRGEHIFGILFTVLGLAVLNLYPQVIGIGAFKDGEWMFIPALSSAFFSYLPWINLLGLFNSLLSLYLLRTGLWTTVVRLVSLAADTAGIVLAAVMLAGPSLVDLDAASMAQVFGEASGNLYSIFTMIPVMVLAILIVVETIEALQIAWKLMKKRAAAKAFLP
jgi:hypothetical protein